MKELHQWQEILATERPVSWDNMTDIPLYMDQVLSYMGRQTIAVEDEDVLTASMVNNYTKNGLMPRAEGKKYHREHLCYLTAICALKQVMSVKDMDLILREELADGVSPQEGYERFCGSLDKALLSASCGMDKFLEEDLLADGAIHFALLSYAMGLASRRYTAILRQKKAEKAENTKKKKCVSEEKEKKSS